MRLVGYAMLVVLSLAIAANAVVSYGFLPLNFVADQLRESFQAHRVSLYLHVFASAVALSLGAFQFSPRLRAMQPAVHRWIGRVYLGVGVLIGGVSGLVMATHAFGGTAARLGFGCLAIVWLSTGACAYAAIRTRNVVSHRRWMVRNFSLTFAAVTLRLYIPVAVAAGATFEQAYPMIAWAAWIPNLIFAEWLFNRRDGSSADAVESGTMSKTREAPAA
jgi:hypothetical protein